ncbi:hypothetical protein GX50_01451 [[Emmonsia] crescens]|uniref:DUF7730 domain-containing protein n=1 Tax=[Emmonsia] crescens TaxID=73230 RepID=A0A2B7ZRC9_9EURO|nr:hypothetical protein GX50_01451 [Emmonsia crescens]
MITKKNLIAKWLCRKNKKQVDPPGLMRSLPIPRAHPLTATPPSLKATANSIFFQRIPPEIRRIILLYAFGEHIVHMDLHLAHPLEMEKTRQRASKPHHANFPRSADRDISKFREWRWYTCVCCRKYYSPINPSLAQDSSSCRLAADGCMPHSYHVFSSDSWPGEMFTEYLVGAMGWLLTCRQAYAEGIDVLYSTNKMHINGMQLFHQLPRLLLPQRLAAIRAVELLWDITPRVQFNPGTDRRPKADMHGFTTLLDALPGTLPNLRLLYLSLQGRFRLPNTTKDGDTFNYSEELLQLVDQMVVNLHTFCECRVALSTSLYRDLERKYRATGQDVGWKHMGNGEEGALWRDILSQKISNHGKGAQGFRNGYWLCDGVRDSVSQRWQTYAI